MYVYIYNINSYVNIYIYMYVYIYNINSYVNI